MNFEENLIYLVYERPMLYDTKNLKYRNHILKEKCWQEIAAKLGRDVKQCKTRWTSLRDRFKKISNQKSELGSGATFKEKWRYFDSLSFLNGVKDENESMVCTMSNHTQFLKEEKYHPISNTIVLSPLEVPMSPASQSQLPGIPSPLPGPSSPPALKRMKYDDGDDDEFSKHLELVSRAIKIFNQAQQNEQKSRIRLFFEHLALKVEEASLSSRELNQLELNLTKLVYDSIDKSQNF